MQKRIANEFKRLDELVLASGVANEDKLMAVDCLKKLPSRCVSFCECYESRDVEEILRLERGMLARLTESIHRAAKAQELAKLLGSRLNKFHEQLGLPQINPGKPRLASQARSCNTV